MAAQARARQTFYHFISCIDVLSYNRSRLRHHPIGEMKLEINAPQKRGLFARLPGAQSEKTPSLISPAWRVSAIPLRPADEVEGDERHVRGHRSPNAGPRFNGSVRSGDGSGAGNM